MDGRVLTGKDAAEAVGAYMRLAAAGARFDGATVRAASRSRWGRAFLAATVREALRGRVPRGRPRASAEAGRRAATRHARRGRAGTPPRRRPAVAGGA